MAGGGLGLDPENDPIIATTDWGLDIKFHNALMDDYGSSSYLGSSGFVYFTMGTYDINNDGIKDPVNWIVIGRASNVNFFDYYIYDGAHSVLDNNLGTQYTFYTAQDYSNHGTKNAQYYKDTIQEITTDAGTAILEAGSNGMIRDYQYFAVTNQPVVNDDELDSGEVLCLSEKSICSSIIREESDSFTHSNYSGSKLQSTINTLYSKGLGLTDAQKSAIQQQNLNTVYYQSTVLRNTTISNQYFFPLAKLINDSSQSFCIETYLNSNTKRDIDSAFWLRTGYTAVGFYERNSCSWYVDGGGDIRNGYSDVFYGVYAYHSLGVRPAFVLKIT
ncbi:MAG: hypothetical protein ACLRFR_03300 [Clostridia bacterium]